jgi:hypothetical protein
MDDNNKPGNEAGETATDIGLPPDEKRKRPGPTIDLEPSEVSDISPAADNPDHEQTADSAISHSEPDSKPDSNSEKNSARGGVLPIAVSALTGALAAALIVAVALWAEWPFALNDGGAAERGEASALAMINARVAKIEARTADSATSGQSAAVDPALADRLKAVEASLASVREDVANLRARAEKTVADLSAVKAARPDAAPAPAIDLSAIEERLGKIERTTAELAATPPSPPHQAAPAPDPRLKQVAAASTLDQAVRSGAPFATALATVKGFAGADALKPLEPFAATGIPDAASLSRELLALLPRLEPKQTDVPAANGILERLQHSAMKLVRVRRVDDAGADVAAIAARAKAAAEHNDISAARRELSALSPAARARVQPWLDKVAARDAALAASRKFVADTMTSLAAPAKPRQ